MTKKRFAAFAAISVALGFLLPTAILFAVDLYLHHKYMDLVGLNAWGYRGPAVHGKQKGEWRLAFLGESTGFGYGVHWREAVPAYLQERLNVSAGAERPVTVLNLAYNNEGAHSYRFTLKDYEYLDYDAVLLYSGYNDLGSNNQAFRHRSVVFRTVGYLPIFPMIFQEKAMAIRWGGRLEDAYWGRKTTFVPNLAQRATATALESAVSVSRSLDTQLGRRLGSSEPEYVNPDGLGLRIIDEGTAEGKECGRQFEHYCGEMYLAIRLALDKGKQVLMVTQPYISVSHREQQDLLRKFLERRFPGNPRLRFASMAEQIDLKDGALAYDGMHLTAAGNRRIAVALEPHVRTLMQ